MATPSLPKRARQRRGMEPEKTVHPPPQLSSGAVNSFGVNVSRDTAEFEYLDHTADIQLHAWADDTPHAFGSVALCMFNYMTDLKAVEKLQMHSLDAAGHDRTSSALF